ncbi:MAG: phosphoenolpyruvate carboxykinase (ATP), partial [Candidatus Lernaella stagnicola]|nr:phosphoenolpyruvate carboxykinase (ATP) [Candidatus Lernaella stagnicola]
MVKNIDTGALRNLGPIHRNLPTAELYEHFIRRNEGRIGAQGQLVVETGKYTGRSPHDKYIVRDKTTAKKIWWSDDNKPFDIDKFRILEARLRAYFQGREVFVQDVYVGTDPAYRLALRIITEHAWTSVFARSLFLPETNKRRLAHFTPDYTVIQAPGFQADPEVDGTRSEAFSVSNFTENKIIIGGTSYAGEVKKSVFTLMNFLLPQRKVLGMHCSANVGHDGDVALFFGLSGTGKTTLSSDPDRSLVGDDEHGWSEEGIFNFEGGCYAKVINLSQEAEPVIWQCVHQFGTVLENVVTDPFTRRLRLDDDSLTVNTRAGYAIGQIENAVHSGRAGHPQNVIMLTADAFGVLPPISKMTADQAMYHFISGYTAKLAGTERGVTEPVATFSACFGRPFMALHPTTYSRLLGRRIAKHKVDCWLINTGWTGGPFGTGHRIPIQHTRAMIHAALE